MFPNEPTKSNEIRVSWSLPVLFELVHFELSVLILLASTVLHHVFHTLRSTVSWRKTVSVEAC